MKSILFAGREWSLATQPAVTLLDEISKELACTPISAILLAQRGGLKWRKIINPDRQAFHSPFLFTQMERAVSRLINAIDRQEKIFIHGDFDADGLTGAAVLYRGLLPLFPTGRIKVEVGDRTSGHGLSRAFIHRVIEEEFNLVITVDCGITDCEQISYLRERGIDTIITDHHLPLDKLPPAIAIIDPHLPEETYPNSSLAGVGVVYKLICGLYERIGRPIPYHFLDLVCIGTIADLVPLATDSEIENRAIVNEGLTLLKQEQGSSYGIRVLMEKLQLKPEQLQTDDIGYQIAPKINAANRAGDPKVAFLLLTTAQQAQAQYLTEVLIDYNDDRTINQQDITYQAKEILTEEHINPQQDGIVIVGGKYWNEGIIGLVASHLVEEYGVPAIVFSYGDRISRASCRSIDGFNIATCLQSCSKMLIHYGGHAMAAGLSLSNEHLAEFITCVHSYLQNYTGPAVREILKIDALIDAHAVNSHTYNDLALLSPFGKGNPTPIFLLPGVLFDELHLVGNGGHHLKGKIMQADITRPFIAFRCGGYIDLLEKTTDAGVICSLEFDSWHNDIQLQLFDVVSPQSRNLISPAGPV